MILTSIVLTLNFIGLSLVNAGLYLPSRSYVFYIPRSLAPGETVGVIHTLDSYVVPCGAVDLPQLESHPENKVTAHWNMTTNTSIVLRVTSSAKSWTIKETFNLTLNLRCQWQGHHLDYYYRPLTTTTLFFHHDQSRDFSSAGKSARGAKGRRSSLSGLCPSDAVYHIIENSENRVVDEYGEFRLSAAANGMTITLTANNGSRDQLTFRNGSRDLIVVTPPDHEQSDRLETVATCSLLQGGVLKANKTFSIVAHIYDVDDSPPQDFLGRSQLRVYDSTDENTLTTFDKDSPEVTDKSSYRIHSNDTMGVIVIGATVFKKWNNSSTILLTSITKTDKKFNDLYVVDVVVENHSYRPQSNTTILNKYIHRFIMRNRKPEMIKIPTIDLHVTAAKFSLVAILRNESEELGQDTIFTKGQSTPLYPNYPLSVTPSGHVYVSNPTGLRLGSLSPSLILHVDQVEKNITVKKFNMSFKPLWHNDHIENCDQGCSVHQSKEHCVISCGYGAVDGRCEWYHGDNTANYSRCTPSLQTCPDELCSDLEMLNPNICPQDCSSGAPRKNRTEPIVGVNQSPCLCDKEPCICLAGQTAEDGDEEVACSTSCKIGLAVAIGVLLVAAMAAGLFTVAWNKSKVAEPLTLKHVHSLVSMAAVPSDYVVDDARDQRPHSHRPGSTVASGQCPAKIAFGQDVFEDKWEFPRCYLTLEHVLGEGEFGQVVRGQAFMLNGQEGNTVVAVKMLKPDASGAEYQDLVSEFQLLKEVDHPNVIKLLGVCTQKGPLCVIVEYCELGSLRGFLRGAKLKCKARSWEEKQRSGGGDTGALSTPTTRTLTFRDLLSFAWQIAKGMDYLASLKIVHRDLAARNVLVTEGLKMKISDFGLSRDVYEADAYLKLSKGRMPVKWMAPESLYAQIYTMKSDVWSYGIVLWEIVTLGASPYPGIPPERLFPLLSTGYRMDRPDDCPEELYAIMQKCWKAEPENRPHFSTLRDILDHLLQQKTEYLELSNDKYFISSLENEKRRPNLNPSYGNVCVVDKCRPDAYVTTNWSADEAGENGCPAEMSKLLIPCENSDLEVACKVRRNSYCNDRSKLSDRLLVHENLTYI